MLMQQNEPLDLKRFKVKQFQTSESRLTVETFDVFVRGSLILRKMRSNLWENWIQGELLINISTRLIHFK